MSRINTRILRVPGVSGQIDERPMGSFMAPLEAAGEALADLGDLGQQIAVKEQQLQDRILASDLETELRESSMRASEAAANAKTIKEIDAIQRGFTADFESIQQRAEGIRGTENKEAFANRASLLGGKASLGLTSLKVNAEVAKAKMQRRNDANRLLAEGIANGDIDGAIAQIEALYEGGVGTLDSEWDDVDAEITSIVGGAQHTNWQIKVDEGGVSAKDVLSAEHLTEGARRSLLSQIAANKGRAEGLAERQALSDISNKVVLLPDHADGVPAGLESLRSDLIDFYGEGSPEVQIAYQEAVESAYTELLDRSASIPDRFDREDSLDSLEGEIRLAREGAQTGAEKKIYDRSLRGIQQLRDQMDTVTEKQRAEQLQQMHESINLGIMEAKIGGYLKPDGTQMNADEFEKMMLNAAGIDGLDANGAWDSESKIVRENFIKAKELILRQKLAYEELTKTPLQRTYEKAVETSDPRAIESLSMQAWLGESSDEAFEESLASGEKDSVYGKAIDAVAKTGIASSHIRDWVLSHDNMADAARKWLAQPDRGFIHFDKSGLSDADADRLLDFTRATLAVRSGSVKPEELDSLFSDKEESRKALMAGARASLEKEELDNFLRNWQEPFRERMSPEERATAGEGEAYVTGMARQLVEDGFYKTEADARIAIANAKSEELENAALFILQESKDRAAFEAFTGEDPDGVDYRMLNSAFRSAAGIVFANRGHNYLTPRAPGEYRATDYSPVAAYGIDSDRARNPVLSPDARTLEGGKIANANNAAWTPHGVHMYDAIREAFPGAIENDTKWLALFSSENVRGGDALRTFLRSANAARELSTDPGMVGGWIQKYDLLDRPETFINSIKASSYEELPSETTFTGQKRSMPADSRINPTAMLAMAESGIVTSGRGRRATPEETAQWNAEARRLKALGYPVQEQAFVYLTKFTFQTSRGPVVVESVPSPRYLIYDAYATQQVGIDIKNTTGPGLKKQNRAQSERNRILAQNRRKREAEEMQENRTPLPPPPKQED